MINIFIYKLSSYVLSFLESGLSTDQDAKNGLYIHERLFTERKGKEKKNVY